MSLEGHAECRSPSCTAALRTNNVLALIQCIAGGPATSSSKFYGRSCCSSCCYSLDAANRCSADQASVAACSRSTTHGVICHHRSHHAQPRRSRPLGWHRPQGKCFRIHTCLSLRALCRSQVCLPVNPGLRCQKGSVKGKLTCWASLVDAFSSQQRRKI